MSGIRSHPPATSCLVGHAYAVAGGMGATLRTSLQNEYFEYGDFLCRIIGCCHDIMKDTDAFQKHLDHPGGTEEAARHSGGGALIAGTLTEMVLARNPSFLKEHFLREWTPAIVFAVCSAHHSSIRRIDMEEHRKAIREWLKSKSDVSSSLIVAAQDEVSIISSIDDVAKETEEKMRSGAGFGADSSKADGRTAFSAMFLCKLLLAAFDEADCDSAMRQSAGIPEPSCFNSTSAVSKFKVNIPFESQNPLDKLRTSFQQAVVVNSSRIAQATVMMLKAPTGLGKTYAAARLIEEIQRIEGACKVFYLAPTTVILNQVADEIFKFNHNANSLILHHLRREMQNDGEERKEENKCTSPENVSERVRRLNSFGEAGLVITTYHRMITMFAELAKSGCTPLNGIGNSIWILDECQSLSFFQFQLLASLISAASELCNARFVLMSATPQSQEIWLDALNSLIWQNPPSAIFLLTVQQMQELENNAYVDGRRLVYPLPEVHLLDELKEKIISYRKANPKKSILVLLNLARDAVELYAALDGQVDYVISNYLRPVDIKKQLNEAALRLKNSDPILMIATSIVQAGVDLDFDTGFVELNDLRTFRQGCGRIGRNYKDMRGVCEVFAFELWDSMAKKTPSWFRQRFARLGESERETGEEYKKAVEAGVSKVLDSQNPMKDTEIEAIEREMEPRTKAIHQWLANTLLLDPCVGELNYASMLDNTGTKKGFAFENVEKFLIDDLYEDDSASPFLVVFTQDEDEERSCLTEKLNCAKIIVNELNRWLPDRMEKFAAYKALKAEIMRMSAPYALHRRDIATDYGRHSRGKILHFKDFDFLLVISHPQYDASCGGWQMANERNASWASESAGIHI